MQENPCLCVSGKTTVSSVRQTHQLSSNQRMADTVLRQMEETSLEAFLSDHYSKGLSLEAIAKELHVATAGAVSPSYGTVKKWLNNFGIKAAS